MSTARSVPPGDGAGLPRSICSRLATAVHAWNDSQFCALLRGLNAGEQEKAGTSPAEAEIAPFAERYPDVKSPRSSPVTARSALQDEAEGAQLLVLGSHGRGGFRGMLLGSTSCAAAVRTVPNDGRASAQQVGCLTEFFSPGLTTHGQGRTLFDRKEEEVTEGWGPPKRPRQRKLR